MNNHKTTTTKRAEATLNRFYDYDAKHLWDRQEFLEYAAAVKACFKNDWLSIGDIHRKLGKRVNRAWTMDAIEFNELEIDDSKLISRYRVRK